MKILNKYYIFSKLQKVGPRSSGPACGQSSMYYRDVATIDGGYLGPSTVLKSVQGVQSSNFRDTHLGGGLRCC